MTLNDQKEKYAEDAFIMNEEKAIKKNHFDQTGRLNLLQKSYFNYLVAHWSKTLS